MIYRKVERPMVSDVQRTGSLGLPSSELPPAVDEIRHYGPETTVEELKPRRPQAVGELRLTGQ